MANGVEKIKTASTKQHGFARFDFSAEMIRRDDSILETYRTASWDAFERLPYPTLTDEAWRRTDLSNLKRDFRLPEKNACQDLQPVPEEMLSRLDRSQPQARIVMLPDGVEKDIEASCCQEGVIFTDFETAAQQYQDELEQALGQILDPEQDKFAALSGALAQNGVFVYVPKDVQVEQPLHSLVWAAGEALAHFSHLIVWLEDGASLTYVHEFASPNNAGEQSLHGGLIEIHVGSNAKLHFVELQSLGENIWNFLHKRARVEQGGTMEWVLGATGSHLSKDFLDLDLVGESAQGRVSGFYFGDGVQHLDYDTQQNHHAPHTSSDLLFKGALKGNSHSVWQGMIYVAPEAQKTDGYQTNPNLMLSDQAHADSIPGLEILADDVRCTHGATVGQIDPEMLFYLRSRGISSVDAERLVVEGFFEPILESIPFDQVCSRLKRTIGKKIDKRD